MPKPTDETPVMYALYSHLGVFESDDFKSWNEAHKKGNPRPAQELRVVKRLDHHLRELKSLLTTPGHEGMLILFYSPGFRWMLDRLAGRTDTGPKADTADHCDLAVAVADEVDKLLQKPENEALAGRLRFITAQDIKPLLEKAKKSQGNNFAFYFTGQAVGMRYDAPKIVEAIARLRLLGNGVPVFRLDSDVLFRFPDPESVVDGDLGLFKAIACARYAYRLRLEDPTVSTFLFSASYDVSGTMDGTASGKDSFAKWSGAYATRVFPALVAQKPDKEKTDKAIDYKETPGDLDELVDADLLRRYYGIKGEAGLEKGEAGLERIGAHPKYAVISGALLCLSDGAIVDLPPFSNFKLNVMWIDDHLKYSLHRALKHFTSGPTLDLRIPELSHARLDRVSVIKARPNLYKPLPIYVFAEYLPTLLMGTILDAWITLEEDQILKSRRADLKGEEAEKWENAKGRGGIGPLPRIMTEALNESKNLDHFDRDAMKDELRKAAIDRIEKVRAAWASLESNGMRTFASYWAGEGDALEKDFGSYFTDPNVTHWKGIAPLHPLSSSLTSLRQLNSGVADMVVKLIDDAVNYVEWTLAWPQYVQIFRSMPQGKFKGDLSWRRQSPTD